MSPLLQADPARLYSSSFSRISHLPAWRVRAPGESKKHPLTVTVSLFSLVASRHAAAEDHGIRCVRLWACTWPRNRVTCRAASLAREFNLAIHMPSESAIPADFISSSRRNSPMDAQHNFSRRLAHVEHLANICGSCFRFILQIIDKPLFSGAGARGVGPSIFLLRL